MTKTQNLCCPREGRVNTKWKLVRRPGREMGSSQSYRKSDLIPLMIVCGAGKDLSPGLLKIKDRYKS